MDVTSAIRLLVVAILVLIVLYLLVKLGARYGKYWQEFDPRYHRSGFWRTSLDIFFVYHNVIP